MFPGGLGFDEGVEDDEQLAHASDEGGHFSFSLGEESPVEGLDDGVVSGGNEGRHAEGGALGFSSAAGGVWHGSRDCPGCTKKSRERSGYFRSDKTQGSARSASRPLGGCCAPKARYQVPPAGRDLACGPMVSSGHAVLRISNRIMSDRGRSDPIGTYSPPPSRPHESSSSFPSPLPRAVK